VKRWGVIFCLFSFSVIALGCASSSGSILVTGTPRTPTLPSQIVLYTTPPPEYELIGSINASSNAGWTQQDSLDYAVERLKIEAAKVGANGVVIKYQGQQSGGSSGVIIPTYEGGGIFVADSYGEMVIKGGAIWVPKEE